MSVASIDEWLDFMPDVIGLEVWTGSDAFGVPTYAASVNYPAYIDDGKIQMIRNLTGEEQASRVKVFIGGTPGIKPEDRITLPVRFVPAQPQIISVSKVSDEAGPHHELVWC